MSTGDPAIDAAFSGAGPVAVSNAPTGDAAIDAAFGAGPKSNAPPASISGLKLFEDMGKSVIGGAAHAAGNLADIFTFTPPGAGSHAEKWSAPFAVTDNPYTSLSPSQQPLHQAVTGALNKWQGPLADTLKERLPQLAEGVGTVLPVVGGRAGPVAEAADASHPLAGAAAAETQRLADMHAQGVAAGLDLPMGASSARAAQAAGNNQPLANAMTRQDLNLPQGAPLTPQLLTQARKVYASPGYEAVKAIPDPIPLTPQAQATLDDVRPLVGNRVTLPEGDSITGQQAVDLSKKLRARAAQLDKAQGITASGDLPSDLADAHRDAAEAIEDATQQHLAATGRGQLAQDWDDARVYTAKTYSAQGALDGAGNVNVSKLKQQILKGKPLSGNMETLANLGAQYPEALRLTPPSAPAPGMIRRGAAALAPSAGALMGEAIGSGLGLPGVGSVMGAAGGKVAAERILPP